MVVTGAISTPIRPPSSEAQPYASSAVRAGRMPTSRAPTRLTAVARSALPVTVCSNTRKNRPLSTMAEATIRITCPLTVIAVAERHRAGCERTGARAFGSEEQQAEAGQQEVQRQRHDQQHQHRCIRDRLEHDACEQRRDRHHQQHGGGDVHRRPACPGAQPARRARKEWPAAVPRTRLRVGCARTRRGAAGCRPRSAPPAPPAPQPVAMVGGRRSVSNAASVNAAKAAMSPKGTKTTRVTEKISTRPSPASR